MKIFDTRSANQGCDNCPCRGETWEWCLETCVDAEVMKRDQEEAEYRNKYAFESPYISNSGLGEDTYDCDGCGKDIDKARAAIWAEELVICLDCQPRKEK